MISGNGNTENMISENGNTEDDEIDEPKMLMTENASNKTKNDLKPREKYTLALIAIQIMFVGYHVFLPNFTLYVPDYKCRDAMMESINDSRAFYSNDSLSSDDQCWSASQNIHNDSIVWINCVHGWKFNKSEGETLASEFNLVCNSAWRRPLLTCLFMIGFLVGSVAGGYLSDRFGRRTAILYSYLALAISVFANSFVGSYMSFLIVWVASAFAHIIVYFTGYVLAQELVPEKKRHLVALLLNFSNACGYLILPLAASLIRDWRWLIRAFGITLFVCLPFIWWLTIESPIWIKQNRAIKKIANEENFLQSSSGSDKEGEMISNESTKTVAMHTLCTNSVLRKRIWITCYLWNVVYLTFYTMNLNSSNLGGSIYVSCALGALVDLAAYVIMTFMLSKLGRRASCTICFLFCGVLCIAAPLMREVHVAAGIACSMTGKFFGTILLGTVILYTSEMFPTMLRNSSVGICSMSSRFASAGAPFLIFAGEMINLSIPFYVMGGLILLAAGLTLLLPETSRSVLPNTVEDAVALEKKSLSCRGKNGSYFVTTGMN